MLPLRRQIPPSTAAGSVSAATTAAAARGHASLDGGEKSWPATAASASPPRRWASTTAGAVTRACIGCARSTAGRPTSWSSCGPSSTPARRASCNCLPHAEPPAPALPAAPAALPNELARLVLDGLSSEHSHRACRRALEEFFSWYQSNAAGEGFTRAVVQRYRSHLSDRGLSAASIILAFAARRKLASEAASNGGRGDANEGAACSC